MQDPLTKDRHFPDRFRLYSGQAYDSMRLRGIEEARPWNLTSIVVSFLRPTDRVLDIGAGTAAKLVALSKHAREIVALEPNEDMRGSAIRNLAAQKISNIQVTQGVAAKLPYSEGEFDVVTSMVAPYEVAEIFRVLKPGGIAIVERVGDRDKWSIKLAFGEDSDGPRGYMSHLAEGELVSRCKAEFEAYFCDVDARNGFWNTYYLRLEDIIYLCSHTPTVRDFDPVRDRESLERISRELTTDRGIVTQQNRVLIVAHKPTLD